MDGGRCMMNDEWWMLNDEWWMVNVEWWMVNDDDDDDGDFDDDDDDDPAELFQTQGKWWELIVWLPFPVMGGFWHCFTHISPGIPMGIPYSLGMTMMPKCRRCDPHGEYELIHRMLVFWRPPFQNKSEWLSWSAEKSDKSYAKPRSFQCKSWITNIFLNNREVDVAQIIYKKHAFRAQTENGQNTISSHQWVLIFVILCLYLYWWMFL